MEQLNTLDDLFEMELRDMYSAEKMIVEAMPMMIEAASSQQLKQKFQQHLEESQNQIKRLEEVFQMLDREPEAEKCDGMAGILKEGEKMIKAQGEPNTKDAALISAAQKVEHYEISSYGTLRTLAQTLGRQKVAEKLQSILSEESRTDKLLSDLAERSSNVQAPQQD